MIRIARIYGTATKADGWRVLVDRLWPRGITKEAARVDVWMKEVAPSNELRKWFGHDEKRWPGFQKRFQAELDEKKELLGELKRMEKKHGALTLLYGAKDEEHNQAIVLLNILRKRK